jgi:hypothetical protein
MYYDYTKSILPPREQRPTRRGSYGGFIGAILIGTLVWLGIGYAAFAEGRDWSQPEASAEAVAVAESNVAVNTGAAAFGGGATINETRQAPALGGLALGGGNPCAYSPGTIQITAIGGGAGVGGMRIDEACSLMVLGVAAGDDRAFKAAGLVIAGRNAEACEAMEQAGMLDCVTKEDRKLRKASTAASSKGGTGTGAKCELAGKTLTFQPTSKAARKAELSACKARFGL